MKHTPIARRNAALTLSLIGGVTALSVVSATADPTVAIPGFTLNTFGSAPTGATKIDSITVGDNSVFVGYADNSIKTGGANDGTSTIAQFNLNGTLAKTFSVAGHNDGLRLDPYTNQLYAMQNEDSNAQLQIINTATSASTVYNLPSVNHGGGFDDIRFLNGNTYITASNPALANNTDPALLQLQVSGTNATLVPVLYGNATATNSANGASTQLNLQDPDSLTTSPDGSLVFTSQADGQLISVHNPGQANQATNFMNLSYLGNPIQIDDTQFTSTGPGTLFITDSSNNSIYTVSGSFTGATYSAITDDLQEQAGGPQTGSIGSLNSDGTLVPFVTGLGGPKGLDFQPAALPTPEPGTTAIMGTGLASILLLGFRRRRAVNH